MKRIAFIHPEGNFNNNPNLYGILVALAESGYAVDIYAPKHNLDQRPPHANVRPLLTSPQHTFPHDAAVLLPSIAQMSPLEAAKTIAPQLEKPALIVGIDRGIIEAQVIAEHLNIPYGLLSYEIYFADETSRNFKLPEILACGNLSFAICQDRVRAKELCRENEIQPNKIIYIPVAAGGIKHRQKSFAIHDALGISRTVKLLLYMGEISCAWAGIFDILAHSGQWPDTWNLVLHHRYGRGAASEIKHLVGESSKKNVHFSPLPPLHHSKMHELLDSVDAGLAFYVPNSGHVLSNSNLKHIGLASGKISSYLQHGVPVVTNPIGEMSDLLASYHAGTTVKDGQQLAATLHYFLTDDASAISANCHRLFREVLDLDVTISSLIAKIRELTDSPTA